MKSAVLLEESRKHDITQDPDKLVRNELKATAKSMIYGEPFPHLLDEECKNYVIGPPRDRMTGEIDKELRDNGIVGLYRY